MQKQHCSNSTRKTFFLSILGIQAEHQHILNVSAANNKRFDKMELYQTLLENHMKDIHTALKNIMEKTKVIAQRTNNLEHDFAVTKRDMDEKINDVRYIH